MLPSDGVATFWPFSWLTLLMLGLTTRDAPPDAAPEMILMALPLDFCQALMAGLGPTYAASSWPASSAVVSSVPELKIDVLSVTPLPRFLVKNPLFSATRADAWVMLARRPRRSVTCWLLLLPLLLLPPEAEGEDDPHPTASAVIAAAPAANTTRLI